MIDRTVDVDNFSFPVKFVCLCRMKICSSGDTFDYKNGISITVSVFIGNSWHHLLAFALLFFCFFFWIDQRNKQEYERRNLKFVKVANLFFATLTKRRVEIAKDEAIKREGKVFGFNMLGAYTVLIAVPELIQEILHKDFTNFTNRRVCCSQFSILSF